MRKQIHHSQKKSYCKTLQEVKETMHSRITANKRKDNKNQIEKKNKKDKSAVNILNEGILRITLNKQKSGGKS